MRLLSKSHWGSEMFEWADVELNVIDWLGNIVGNIIVNGNGKVCLKYWNDALEFIHFNMQNYCVKVTTKGWAGAGIDGANWREETHCVKKKKDCGTGVVRHFFATAFFRNLSECRLEMQCIFVVERLIVCWWQFAWRWEREQCIESVAKVKKCWIVYFLFFCPGFHLLVRRLVYYFVEARKKGNKVKSNAISH